MAAYSHEHRFGTDDDRYEGWLYTPGFGPAYGWVALAATPDNDFLADWECQAGAEAWASVSPEDVVLLELDKHA